MGKPTVAILGASTNRRKFGNKSVRAHHQQGYVVYPVNPKAEEVEGLKAYARLSEVPVEELDRVSIYLPPQLGLEALEDIKQKGAREVWFNPGAESPEIEQRARELDLTIIMDCSIVDLGVTPAQFPD